LRFGVGMENTVDVNWLKRYDKHVRALVGS
jgi:hypothetical protein